MYIRVNMPPVVEFDPLSAVLYWLHKKKYHSGVAPKATSQEWFRHVFSEVEQKQEDPPNQLTVHKVQF